MPANILTQCKTNLTNATKNFFYSREKKLKGDSSAADIDNLPRDTQGKIPYYSEKNTLESFLAYYYLNNPDAPAEFGSVLRLIFDRWNEMGREDVFEFDSATLMFRTRLCKNTLISVRNLLLESGAIAYVGGNRGHNAFYKLADFRVFELIGYDKMKPFKIKSKELKDAIRKAEKSAMAAESDTVTEAVREYIERISGNTNGKNIAHAEYQQNEAVPMDVKDSAIETPGAQKKPKEKSFVLSRKASEIAAAIRKAGNENSKNTEINKSDTWTSKNETSPSHGPQNVFSIYKETENKTESICPDFKKSEQIQEEDRARDAALASISQDIFDSLQDKWSATFPGSHIHSSRRRMKRLQNLIEEFGADRVREAISKVFASSFLMGKVELDDGGFFKLKVDFILSRSHFVEIIEGHYDDATYRARPTCENINNTAYQGFSQMSAQRRRQYEENVQDDYDYVYGLGDYAEDGEEGMHPACEKINIEKTSEAVTTNGAVVPETVSAGAVETAPEPVVDVGDMSDEDWFYSLGWALT